MNKTVYLRDEEGPVWERARELAGDKLSPVIVSALRQFVATEEAKPRGFERIELSFEDADDHDLPKRKAFYGKWVFSPAEPLVVEDGENPEAYNSAVAVTQRGQAVFHTWWEDHQNDRRDRFKFVVRPSLAVAAADPYLNHAARAAIEKIGVPIEELDI